MSTTLDADLDSLTLPEGTAGGTPAHVGQDNSLHRWGEPQTSRTRWSQRLAALAEYAAHHGHTCPPEDYVTGDQFSLGKWVVRQRHYGRDGTLTSEQVRALEALPGWTWSPNAARWERGFAALADFLAQNGGRYPTHDATVEGYPLGDWVRRQRGLYRQGRLPRERASRLEGLSGWTWSPPRGFRTMRAEWEDVRQIGFRALEAFVAAYGHARTPKHYKTPDGFALGQWVNSQRYRRNRNTGLARVHADKLEALPGWSWNAQADAWETGFVALVEFMAENRGRMPGRKHLAASGIQLGQWVW